MMSLRQSRSSDEVTAVECRQRLAWSGQLMLAEMRSRLSDIIGHGSHRSNQLQRPALTTLNYTYTRLQSMTYSTRSRQCGPILAGADLGRI